MADAVMGTDGPGSRHRHPLLAEKLTLAGGDGDDAQPYQERQVRRILTQLREAQGHQR